MSAPHTIHPPENELAAFGMGRLPPDDNQRIEQHLEACPTCCETMLDLKDDTFVELVRAVRLNANTEATLDIGGGGATTRTESTAALPPELRQHARYEILGLIGRGGMGDVYKAQHKVMNRPVALKVIKPELVQNDAAVKRFHREVQAAARLHDRNIVTAYDAEQAGGLHFLVMEFVDGVNLDEVVRKRGPLPVDQACDYIRQAAAGLQHAHTLGMVHRDIKPHNLMLTAAGEVKILDFGLANFASELATDDVLVEPSGTVNTPQPHQLTQMGSMMGTPDYIAPEQARDAHAADIRADIYSLGCTFYTLLAGRPPFKPSSLVDKLKAHAEQVPPPLMEVRGDVPPEISAILLKMLAKNPADRYQSPQELIAALETIRGSIGAPTVQLAPDQESLRPRAKILIALATLLITAFAAMVFYIQTNNGVVRVEVADESLQVKLNGRTIEMKDGETPLTIQVGEPKLIVQRGDFKFETEGFQLRRGDKVALKVEVQAGEVVVLKDGQRFGARTLPRQALAGEPLPPLVIGMNQEFGMLFEGRLVAPAELSRRLGEAIKENPDRVVAIDLPKRPWAVAGHVDQLEQIAHTMGAKHITRPAWSEIRIRFGVVNGSAQTLVIEGPGHSASGFAKSYLPNVREVIAKNPGLPVFLDVDAGVNLADPKIAAGLDEVRSVAETAGAKVRILRAGLNNVNVPKSPGPTKEIVALDRKLAGEKASVNRVAFSRDGKFVLAACGSNILRWHRGSGELEGTYPLGTQLFNAFVPLSDNQRVVTSSKDGKVRLWELASAKVLQEYKPHGGTTGGLAVSPDEKLVASGGDDSYMRVSELEGGKLLREVHPAWCRAVTFSDDGQKIAFGNQFRAVVYDVQTWTQIQSFNITKTASARALDFSPDGKLLLTGTDSGGVMLWDIAAAKPLHTIRATGPVRSVAFLPDGRHFVVGSEDRKLRLFSAATGEVVQEIADTSYGTNWVAVAPDGKTVASGGGLYLADPDNFKYQFDGDGDVRLWRLPELAWPNGVNLAPEEGAALTDEKVKSLVSAAAGVTRQQWATLAGDINGPDPAAITGTPLTLLLMTLNPLEAAKSQPDVKQDFWYLSEGLPKPSLIDKAVQPSQQEGYVSFLQPRYITNVSVQSSGDTASGTVGFVVPKLYSGSVAFQARKVQGNWEVVEFQLPHYGITLNRSVEGIWQRK